MPADRDRPNHLGIQHRQHKMALITSGNGARLIVLWGDSRLQPLGGRRGVGGRVPRAVARSGRRRRGGGGGDGAEGSVGSGHVADHVAVYAAENLWDWAARTAVIQLAARGTSSEQGAGGGGAG